jgi:signal transduction histidine kinase
MIRRFLEWVLRTRYGFPALVVGAVAVMAVNELTYQNQTSTLTRGIRLTDIRIKAAQTLQLVTDAETSVRGYVMTGHTRHLDVYKKALELLPQVSEQAFGLIDSLNDDKNINVDELKSLISARLGELSLLQSLKQAGKDAETTEMLMTDVGSNKMTALREAFDRTLESAAGVQAVARVSIYEAAALTRWTVHLLILATLTGFYFLMRQLIQADEMRATETERLEQLAKKRTEELRELAGHLVTAREDERHRVARELHDDLGALLTATKLDLARLKRHEGLSPAVQERLVSMEERVKQGISLKRRIIENLHPSALDQLGLVASLELLCKDMGSSMSTQLALKAKDISVSPDIALTLYRMVQESLTNIAKYARARTATVSLESTANKVVLRVEDDGQGFDINAVGHGHHGLMGLRYRVESHGGTFHVKSAPDQGTTVVATITTPVTDVAF